MKTIKEPWYKGHIARQVARWGWGLQSEVKVTKNTLDNSVSVLYPAPNSQPNHREVMLKYLQDTYREVKMWRVDHY